MIDHLFEGLRIHSQLSVIPRSFIQVLLCTDEMMNGTLNEALNSSQPDLSQVKVRCQIYSLPRYSMSSRFYTNQHFVELMKRPC